MGLISRRKSAKRSALTLRIDVVQARIVTVENSRCNPLCLVITNGVFSRTKKVRNTGSPQWGQTLKLKLPTKAESEYLRIVLYDDMLRRQKDSAECLQRGRFLYLGEVRMSLLDMFNDSHECSYLELRRQWYPIYGGKEQEYKAGDVELGFVLQCTSKTAHMATVFEEWRNNLVDTLEVRRVRRQQEIELLSENIGKDANGNKHKDDLDFLRRTPDYTSYEDIVGSSILSSDGDEDDEDDEEDEDENYGINELLERPDDEADFWRLNNGTMLDNYMQGDDSSDTIALVHEPSVTSVTEVSETPFGRVNSRSSDGETDVIPFGRPKRNLLKATIKENSFEISKRTHALGVALLNIEKITDLPPLKSKFSTSFDMDPFVIISFGRRVFKTSWRKHTLNPEYHECAAFEVYPNELSFMLDFRVMDKDSFSFHDRIADASIMVRQITESKKMEDGSYQCALAIPLVLVDASFSKGYHPKLYLTGKFFPYFVLKKMFWEKVVNTVSSLNEFDVVQLTLLLAGLGDFSDEAVNEFFYHANKSPWSRDTVTKEEVINSLQNWQKLSVFRRVSKCPLCGAKVKTTKYLRNSKLNLENDLVTHFAVCGKTERRLLKPSYVSSDFASKRWFSKLLIKLTYGRYALGSNNANILVQDRDTGIVIEEKISFYVKLGIRIIYNARGKQSRKFRSLLRLVTIKQGKKFDRPISAKEIGPFIKFHSLDMSECEVIKFNTFNEFFYRKLKPGSRPPESPDPKVLLSPADSRCTVFTSITKSMEVWIKGRSFTLSKLAGYHYPEVYNERSYGIGIFRLAPQDYHRFHSPCNAVIGEPKFISGEYYTVNPMAIRTSLDVFGENVRVVIPLESEEFGTILYIAVGAMMVGSIILTCKVGDKVERGQELGYFKFGGSTVLLVFSNKKTVLDTDLVKNSEETIETLVKVGMSIGHTPDVKEHRRTKVLVEDSSEIERIKRAITVSEETAETIGHTSWEYRTLKKLNDEDPEIDGLFDILSD